MLCAAMLLTAATWAVFRHGGAPSEEELPVLGVVPEFSLLASTGQPLSRRDLAGSVWIADFIFTRCGSICPILTAQMAKIQAALARAGDTSVRLVSFSVDPAYDTPEVLQEYATRFHADPNRWTFVTGQRNVLYGLIGAGFHLAVADRPEGGNTDGGGLITHGDSFVLVDGSFNIRGYYHGTDAESVQQLLSDLGKLEPAALSACSRESCP
jgi:protein SCO1/2